VAHRADRVLRHGVAAFDLDGFGEIAACARIMVHVARAGAAPAAHPPTTEDALAGLLRLPPQVVRTLCARLVKRGLLVDGPGGYILGCDPRETDLASVLDAAQRDPDLEATHAEEVARLPRPAQAAVLRILSRPADPALNPTLAQLVEAPA
jgi:DNA-binding IscR family transcriptional regulator